MQGIEKQTRLDEVPEATRHDLNVNHSTAPTNEDARLGERLRRRQPLIGLRLLDDIYQSADA